MGHENAAPTRFGGQRHRIVLIKELIKDVNNAVWTNQDGVILNEGVKPKRVGKNHGHTRRFTRCFADLGFERGSTFQSFAMGGPKGSDYVANGDMIHWKMFCRA
ncbi:MAG: hypothetical protein C4527_28865 [Candidatus Omnitrophota bacterium]|nr:MAG: hypothetical protein C4527_28865 [Candidatus Omnitrophota bacterium]